MGAGTLGPTYTPFLPDIASLCKEAAKGKSADVQHHSPFQDGHMNPQDHGPGRRSNVPRSRYSTMEDHEPKDRTLPPESIKRGQSPRRLLNSSTSAGPSRPAPPPPPQPVEITEQPKSPHMLNVRDIVVEGIEGTPWQEYELPSELEHVLPDVPEEIRNIIQESLDEQRALRLSSLQAPAIVVGPSDSEDRAHPAAEQVVTAESSATASDRQNGSSPSSLRAGSVGILINSATSLALHDLGNGPLDPYESNQRLSPRSSGEHQRSDLFLSRRRLQKSREKLSKAHGLFRSLRRPRTSSAAEQEPEPATYECTSCFDDIPSSEAVRVPCLHYYCSACFSQLIATALQNEDQFPPKCCLQDIPRGVVRQHLKPRELTTYDEKALEAEFCYTCGARWRTCACTEEDQARRARQIRENLERLDAEARAEEAEIRAAIAAVEAAERQAAEERAEEERRQEEERAEEARQLAEREAQRMEKITQHYAHLREILEQIRVHQTNALANRHERELQDFETRQNTLMGTGKQASTESRRAQIINDTDTKLQDLRKDHATTLVQTRVRHRKDEDEFLLKLTTELASDPDEPDPATKLDSLLHSQEAERAALR
ncbi:MAG: hypothetical protein Q9222_007310, partial [Ikaeria aurantiellina]